MGEIIEFNNKHIKNIKNNFSDDLFFFVKIIKKYKNLPVQIYDIGYSEKMQTWEVIADIGDFKQMTELRNKTIKTIMKLKEKQKNSPTIDQSK